MKLLGSHDVLKGGSLITVLFFLSSLFLSSHALAESYCNQLLKGEAQYQLVKLSYERVVAGPQQVQDVEPMVGQTLVVVTRDHDPIGIRFETEVVDASTEKDVPESVVNELVEQSMVRDLEREVGAVLVQAGDLTFVLYFTSNSTLEIDASERLLARERMKELVLSNVYARGLVEHSNGRGIVVHDLHTHPVHGTDPHSADDLAVAKSDYRFWREVLGEEVLVRSHVVPLKYSGRIVLTIRLREHGIRAFRISDGEG